MRPTHHDTAVGLQQLRFAAPTPSGPSPVRAPTETSSHFLRAPAVSPAPRPPVTRNTSNSTSAALPGRSRGSTGATGPQRSSAPSNQPYRCRAERRQPASAVPRAWKHAWKGTQIRLMRRADGRAGWRLGLSAASNDDGEERDQPFGAGESAAQSETETRNEAEQRDDQGNRYGAHFAIRDTLTLVQR